MEAEHFAGRLKELREQAGLSQKELADRVGQTVRQVSRLETGAQKPSWETALALCRALGVSCEAFTQKPAAQPEPRRGRPPKPPGLAEVPGQKAKRSRGGKGGGK
jgi:transcriptional regulator with XRE-family HTH domain